MGSNMYGPNGEKYTSETSFVLSVCSYTRYIWYAYNNMWIRLNVRFLECYPPTSPNAPYSIIQPLERVGKMVRNRQMSEYMMSTSECCKTRSCLRVVEEPLQQSRWRSFSHKYIPKRGPMFNSTWSTKSKHVHYTRKARCCCKTARN